MLKLYSTYADSAIVVREVSKTFNYPSHKPSSLRARLIQKFRGCPKESRYTPFSLKNINLRIKKGESVALIGDNGSGKSSLLRLIAGIYQPSAGRIECYGRVSTVLELGAGFHPQVSGIENIGISAAALGVNRSEFAMALPSILSFADLGDDLQKPLKHYSSGMRARLAFSVAVSIQSDILLLDEVLAVGDQSFQKKCLARIQDIHTAGSTIVYVSHDLESVRNLCDRTILLDRGKIVADGSSGLVISNYIKNL